MRLSESQRMGKVMDKSEIIRLDRVPFIRRKMKFVPPELSSIERLRRSSIAQMKRSMVNGDAVATRANPTSNKEREQLR